MSRRPASSRASNPVGAKSYQAVHLDETFKSSLRGGGGGGETKKKPNTKKNTKSIFTLLLRRVSLVADLKDVTPYASAVGTSSQIAPEPLVQQLHLGNE